MLHFKRYRNGIPFYPPYVPVPESHYFIGIIRKFFSAFCVENYFHRIILNIFECPADLAVESFPIPQNYVALYTYESLDTWGWSCSGNNVF